MFTLLEASSPKISSRVEGVPQTVVEGLRDLTYLYILRLIVIVIVPEGTYINPIRLITPIRNPFLNFLFQRDNGKKSIKWVNVSWFLYSNILKNMVGISLYCLTDECPFFESLYKKNKKKLVYELYEQIITQKTN